MSTEARPVSWLRFLPALGLLAWVGWSWYSIVWRDQGDVSGRGLVFPLIVLGLWIITEIAWSYISSRDKPKDPLLLRFGRVVVLIALAVATMLAWALLGADI